MLHSDAAPTGPAEDEQGHHVILRWADLGIGGKLLLRVPQAALLCGVSRAEAYNMVKRGDWAHVRVGLKNTGVRVVVASIFAWIEREQRRGYAEGEIEEEHE
jgi:predicted DNA-binding transcriptional regulator AlpA